MQPEVVVLAHKRVAYCALAITSCSPSLLDPVFDRTRQSNMHHEPDVGLVHTHAERDSGYNYAHPATGEFIVHASTLRRRPARVVEVSLPAPPAVVPRERAATPCSLVAFTEVALVSRSPIGRASRSISSRRRSREALGVISARSSRFGRCSSMRSTPSGGMHRFAAIDSTVRDVAVAVRARTVVMPRVLSVRPTAMYAGRKLCDHSDRQCASSTHAKPTAGSATAPHSAHVVPAEARPVRDAANCAAAPAAPHRHPATGGSVRSMCWNALSASRSGATKSTRDAAAPHVSRHRSAA
eukprot:scaffold45588_cov31-Tisochrysis_lutea.AAC.2